MCRGTNRLIPVVVLALTVLCWTGCRLIFLPDEDKDKPSLNATPTATPEPTFTLTLFPTPCPTLVPYPTPTLFATPVSKMCETGWGASPCGVINPDQARLMAQRAATVIAQLNLFNYVRDLPLTNGQTINEAMAVSSALRVDIEEVVRGAVIEPDPISGEDYAELLNGTIYVVICINQADLAAVLSSYGLFLQ